MHLGICIAILARVVSLGLAATVPRKSAALVVSFDGFRYDYFEKHVTPIMEKLRKQGTHAEYLKNVFPTKTFPNHYSIATGLFPEVHGVLGSSLYDPKYDRILKYGYELFHYNEDVLPLWTLNEQSAAKGHHSGVMMWPGGDLKYHGLTNTFAKSFVKGSPWKERIDTVISWFLHPNTPANLVFLYLEDPDRHSHVFGPDSPQAIEQLRKLDNVTGYLHSRLKENNLAEVVNVILLSDHGMDTVTNDTIINLKPHIENLVDKEYGSSPVTFLIPIRGKEEELYKKLKELSRNGHFNVYRKNEIPERWHFKNNARAPPILIVADEGYGFHDLYGSKAYYQEKWNLPDDMNMTLGVHGYDNEEMKMHPFFMAWGPQIKEQYTIPPFESVDIYSLLSEMLELQPPKTNGSLANVVSMLRDRRT